MKRAEWIDRYAAAWRERDPEAIVELFTPGAVYHYSPTAAPVVGRERIAEHWARATATFTELDLRFGRPVDDADRTVVEMWATLRDAAWHERRTGQAPREGEDWLTFPGCLVLRFDEQGLCAEHHEYYDIVFGRKIDAPPNWGV